MTTPTLSLSPLFSDHAILQRNQPAKIWGWTAAGNRVTVTLAGQSASAVADSTGRWLVTLAALPAGGPFELAAVSDDGARIRSKDILIGEVWLCSGQSNMEWTNAANATDRQEIEAAANLPLRCITVPRTFSKTPNPSLDAAWQTPEPKEVANWTAAGFAFARHLHKKLGVPIGLVSSNYGGASAEAFIPTGVLEKSPNLRPILVRMKLPADLKVASNNFHVDPGNAGVGKGWHSPIHDDSDWSSMTLPATWQSALKVTHNGSMWFRRTVELTSDEIGQDLPLGIGACDDFDVTYFNGEVVGAMGMETPDSWVKPREYTIPKRLLKAGKNLIAVRVFDHAGSGGMVGPADTMLLTTPKREIPLAGPWKYRVELALELMASPSLQNYPELLYNAMMAPLFPLALAGAIWYQGESNADRAWQYRELLSAVIDHWRQKFGRDFPFYQVQLSNYTPRRETAGDSAWAELRDSQRWIAENHPHGGMVVAFDGGHATDIHPKNKVVLGYRLAQLALAKTYGVAGIEYSGPKFARMKSEKAGNTTRLRVRFDHAEGLFALGDGKVFGFQIAGEDKQWHWAYAVVEGHDVLLQSKKVPSPVAVRYAWSDNPQTNLMNIYGLPAEPFRTDDWPLITVEKM
jgi:sialate O-acetylesterase